MTRTRTDGRLLEDAAAWAPRRAGVETLQLQGRRPTAEQRFEMTPNDYGFVTQQTDTPERAETTDGRGRRRSEGRALGEEESEEGSVSNVDLRGGVA